MPPDREEERRQEAWRAAGNSSASPARSAGATGLLTAVPRRPVRSHSELGGALAILEDLDAAELAIRRPGTPFTPADFIIDTSVEPLDPRRMVFSEGTLWAATELEPRVLEVSRNRLPQIDREPDEARAQEAEAELLPTLRVLDSALAGSDQLVEGRFTVADVNVASVLAPGISARIDFAPVSNVEKWINACIRRPAARSVFARAMKSAGLA